MFLVCHVFLSVVSSLVVTRWERIGLLALLCVMFSFVFVTLPCGVLGQVWYLIVSISDLCLLSYFSLQKNKGEVKIRWGEAGLSPPLKYFY